MDSKNNFNDLREYYLEDEVDSIESFVDGYIDKSEDEIFVEIIKLNNMIEEEMSFEQYELIFYKLKSIRNLLSSEQNIKLNKLLEALGKDS